MLRLLHPPATRPHNRRGPRLVAIHTTFARKTCDMAEDEGALDTLSPASNGSDTMPQVGVVAQYVKDMSFENPNAPVVFQWQSQPQTDVQVNIGTMLAGPDLHEVTIKIDITATATEGTAFRVELLYAGLFALTNIPADQLQPFLLAEAPRILFPFARKIIADATVEGGFPPLRLDPIDFTGLYLQSAAQAAAEGSGGVAGDVTGTA